MRAAAIDLLHRAIADPDTQWSLGTFGAIAEFSRDPDEPVTLRQSDDAVSAVTAARRHRHPASSAHTRPWRPKASPNQAGTSASRCACPKPMARWTGRTVLTELGADIEALRAEDRESVLFDLGLGAPHADFCVRIGDPNVAAATAPACRPGGVRTRQSRDGIDPWRQSASRLHQPARPHRGLSTDPAGFGQESRRGRTRMCCQAAEEPAGPIRRPSRSPRAGCPARIFIRRIRRATDWARPGHSTRRVIAAFQSVIERFGSP